MGSSRFNKEAHCPLINKGCMAEECALYDPTLRNCAIHLVAHNLYKVDRTLNEACSSDSDRRKRFPFELR